MTSRKRPNIERLLSELTLEEKIAQLGSKWMYDLQSKGKLDQGKVADKLQHGIGQMTRVTGASTLGPRSAAAAANQLQRYLYKTEWRKSDCKILQLFKESSANECSKNLIQRQV